MRQDSLDPDKYHQMRLALDELVDGDLRRFRPDRRMGLDLRPERRRLDRLEASSSDDEGVLKIKVRANKHNFNITVWLFSTASQEHL